jgi:ribonuclease HI
MCSRQGLTWKAKLPDDIREAWDPWMAQVQELNGYSFIRTIISGEQPNKTNKQIHVFADASKDAYAAVAYMRCESNGKATVRFIQAKSRVRPVKAAHTIPRMELLAIELGLQLVKKINKTFKIETNSLYIWTDSRACHDWLRIEARALQVFIKTRVLKVRQFLKLQQVKWVPGVLNSADSAMRGISEAQPRMAAGAGLPPRTPRHLARPTPATGRIDSRSSSSNNTGNETGKEKIRKNLNHGNLPSKSPTGNRPLLQTNDTKHL